MARREGQRRNYHAGHLVFREGSARAWPLAIPAFTEPTDASDGLCHTVKAVTYTTKCNNASSRRNVLFLIHCGAGNRCKTRAGFNHQ